MVVVERFEIVLQQLSGDVVIELLAAVMALLEQAPDGDFDLARIRIIRGNDDQRDERKGRQRKGEKTQEVSSQ